MKKYTIIHNFTAVASIDVIAETREEAFEKAKTNELNLADYQFELDNAEIGSEEDIPDLSGLIEQAETIIKKADAEDNDVILNPWPRVTTEYWTGETMEHHQDLMTNIFWNYEDDEIGFNTVNSASDFDLSELPEIEQYQLCQTIIAQAENNNIKIQ